MSFPKTIQCWSNDQKYSTFLNGVYSAHGLNNYKDTKRLISSLLLFIDGRCRQSCWYFRPALWTNAPLTSLWLALPPPPPITPFPVWISIFVYTYTVCTGGGVWVIEGERPQTDTTPAAKSLYRSLFLENDIWHWFLWVYSNLSMFTVSVQLEQHKYVLYYLQNKNIPKFQILYFRTTNN